MGLFAGRGNRCNSRTLALIAGAAVALGAAQAALAADVAVSWATAVAGTWNTAGNWSPAVVPNNGVDQYLVSITAADAPYLVTLDIPATIKDFTMTGADAQMELLNNLLTINRDFTVTNTRIQSTARGGQMNVTGTARINNTHFHETRMVCNGPLIFEGSGTNDICDTEIDHEGSIMTWTDNGTITLDDGTIGARLINGISSVFTMTGDGTMLYSIGPRGTFENRGTTIKNGGTGVTFINGVTLDNTGTIDLRTGTFRVTNCTQYDSPNQKLTGGKWLIGNNTTLDFTTQTILKNGAEVTLTGASSVFTQINGLTENSLGGKFTVTGSRNFTTAGAFTNNGTLVVGTGSTFRIAPGSTLTQGAGSVVDLAGKLQEDGANVTTLSGHKIILRAGGQYVNQLNVDALANMNTINSGGHFHTIGTNYTFTNPLLTLGSGGTLTIGDSGTGNSSVVTVNSISYDPGSTLNIVNGRIVIAGTMVQRGTLQGNGTVQGDVVSQGVISPGESPGTLTIDGNLQIDTNSVYHCELLSHTLGGFDVINVIGDVSFDGGTTGFSGSFDLALLAGFTASLGDQFDVMVFRNRFGQNFANITGLNTANFGFASQFTENTLRLTVVRIPAPGGLAALGLAGLLAARRRR